MSVHLKVIAAVLIVLLLVLLSGSAAGKKVKKPEQIPLTPYQLRYATIGIPYGVEVETDFSYEIRKNIYDDDNAVSINTRIEVYDSIDIQAYFDAEIARIRNENKVVNITKQKTETIDGNKALVLHIDHKTNENFSSMKFTEYVGILCGEHCVLFKAWGFLDLFIPGEYLWQAMYRSFRSDHSQPYKLPFGSFILPKEARDWSYMLPYFPNAKDYKVEINYISDSRAQEIIREYKPNILGTFLRAKIFILKDKTVIVDGRQGRYFEARVIIDGKIIPDATFHIQDGDKTVLQISAGSNQLKTFKRCRPQLEAMIQSIRFDESAGTASGEE